MGVNMPRVWKRQEKGEKCICVKTEWKVDSVQEFIANWESVQRFNKRANPRHSKTDREGKKERAGGGGLLFACYIQRHLINLPGTQHNTHNTPRDVSVIPCSPMRFPLYLRLKVLSLPVSKSVIFCLSHTLSFYALLFCFFPSLGGFFSSLPTPLPLNLSQISFSWTPSESIWTYRVCESSSV